MNITDLFPDGTLKFVADTYGGEWSSSCPWCGGTKRFRVWPKHSRGAGGRYWCRECDKSGSAVDLLKELHHLYDWEAIRLIGDGQPSGVTKPTQETVSKPTTNRPTDPTVWQERARWFIDDCAERMVPESRGLEYALSRHLKPETVAQFGIGWNPHDKSETRDRWGLALNESQPNGGKKVWLPKGLVVPCQEAGLISGVLIRRKDWHANDPLPKHVMITGGTIGLKLFTDAGRPVVVVESVLDAMLLWQEARDLVDVLALGTAQRNFDQTTKDYLNKAPLVFVSLDYDETGLKAAKTWEQYRNARFWPVPTGKDVGDIAGTPGLVREWLELGIKKYLLAKQ